ncbi:predicted protein [Chaetomium globosum CBS 148.51]|uniref:Uncharacterized protein n=1 Tax=Chaetomium globosum (strain ATCC 6205 / CBS 148.51 / DSM 1962 / NBRC 6347 / NRRL 1970) TaxID=306901 RepID=Q2GYS0_CHAGB|nr:uncharacterized protein CHGG_06884 [Chaetomium globosum CBS 148.51]EAQ85631.1 predicted protein [Chaetomium globosum CBS 148.51]
MMLLYSVEQATGIAGDGYTSRVACKGETDRPTDQGRVRMGLLKKPADGGWGDDSLMGDKVSPLR